MRRSPAISEQIPRAVFEKSRFENMKWISVSNHYSLQRKIQFGKIGPKKSVYAALNGSERFVYTRPGRWKPPDVGTMAFRAYSGFPFLKAQNLQILW